MFDTIDLANIPRDAAMWEKVIRKLNTRTMPPLGARRPDEASYHALASWLEMRSIARAAAVPNPGRPLLHRLNRAEYANAIRDLLRSTWTSRRCCRPTIRLRLRQHCGRARRARRSLLERYLVAAEKISARRSAIRRGIASARRTYRVRQDSVAGSAHRRAAARHGRRDCSCGTRSRSTASTRCRRGCSAPTSATMRGLEYPHAGRDQRGRRARASRDDRRRRRPSRRRSSNADRRRRDAIDARASRCGFRSRPARTRSASAFVERSRGSTTRAAAAVHPQLGRHATTGPGGPHIDTLTVTGPFNATGPGDTPSRRRIFVVPPGERPASEARVRHGRSSSTLARRAYRQPVHRRRSAAVLMTFYQAGRRDGHVRHRHPARAAADPREPEVRVPRRARSGRTSPPGTRLSPRATSSWRRGCRSSSGAAFRTTNCWTSAAQGKLRTPAVLEQQVRRMLADPNVAARSSTNFAGQWLQLRNLRNVLPNSDEFPDFDDNLRQAFQRETELFFDSIMREDRSVLDLLTADYTFVNERLARHYGIPNIYGSQFRRVTVTDEARQGSARPGQHPDGHVARRPDVAGACAASGFSRTSSARRRRRRRPTCRRSRRTEPGSSRARCASGWRSTGRIRSARAATSVMDPLGFALENFDAVGAWRTRDAGAPHRCVRAAGRRHARSTAWSTLRQALLKRPDVFVGTLTEKLLTYALGRGLDYYDMPAVRDDRPRRRAQRLPVLVAHPGHRQRARRFRCG